MNEFRALVDAELARCRRQAGHGPAPRVGAR
jgi:hypothetical protein